VTDTEKLQPDDKGDNVQTERPVYLIFFGCYGINIRVSTEFIAYLKNFTYRCENLCFSEQVSKLRSTITYLDFEVAFHNNIPYHLISYYILISRKTLCHRIRIDMSVRTSEWVYGMDVRAHSVHPLMIHSFSQSVVDSFFSNLATR